MYNIEVSERIHKEKMPKEGIRMINAMASLKNQRNRLVDEWVSAQGKERVKILVRIMDLEEEIKLCEDRGKKFSRT